MRNQDDVRIQYTTAPSRRERLETVRKEFKFRSRSKIIDIMVDDGTEKLESKIHIADETQAKEIRDGILQIAKDIAVIRTALLKTTSNINQIAKNSNVIAKGAGSPSEEALENLRVAQESFDVVVKLNICGAAYESAERNLKKAQEALGDSSQATLLITKEELDNMSLNTDDIKALIAELNEASAALGEQVWKVLQ